jgi:hypothetical protein
MSTDTRILHDALLTDVHLAEIRKATLAKTIPVVAGSHPNDVATDAEVEADLARATFADDGALEVS